MDRGWGGLLRKAALAQALLLGLLALSAPAFGAGDPPPIPKPDPPPKANPPPPLPASGPPPAQPVAPAPVVTAPVAPAVVHPTAAERRVAAQRRAKRKAARVARAKAKAATKLAAAQRRERAQAQLAAVASATSSSSNWGLPFLLVVFSAALLMLGLALTPARAVPWNRASRVLEDRRDELGVMGAMGLVATFVFFLLVQVTS